MNTLPAVVSPPTSVALIPSTISEGMQLANLMSTARLVPAALQKSPGDCFMIIQLAMRWNMDPFAVAQECSVISGKLMTSGKLAAAVINTRGQLAQRLTYSYSGTGDDRMVTVTARLASEPENRTVEVKLRDVRTNNGAWKSQPDQQLAYSGARIWGRRHTPELMLGVYFEGEGEAIEATAAAAEGRGVRPVSTTPIAAPSPPLSDPVTGEIGPRLVEIDEGEGFASWGQRLIAFVRAATSVEEVDRWVTENAPLLDDMGREVPKMHKTLSRSIEQHRVLLAGGEPAGESAERTGPEITPEMERDQ
jgi:hypothetical protein